MSPVANAKSWDQLPTEMKLAIFDRLDSSTVVSFSKTNKVSYSLCVPYTFQRVNLEDFASLRRFVDSVPTHYLKHILQLDVCTKSNLDNFEPPSSSHPRTDALASLLAGALRLEKLSLRLEGSLDKKIIPYFSHLFDLTELSISNWGEESNMPISERLVVSIAATIPSLHTLSLDHITRSSMHAPELLGGYPYVPLVDNDSDIPSHPLLQSALSLPSLLRIPTLKTLTIRDTHLGDPLWATTPILCRLEMLDLGSCYHETDAFNATCTERIMSAVGPSISEFALTTAISGELFAEPGATPLKKLRKLHISPYFPLESVVETMSSLAGSPIESLSMQCFRDDAVEVCAAVEEFLNLRVERGPEFYERLARIDLSVVKDAGSSLDGEDDEDVEMVDGSDEDEEWKKAARQLQEYCHDLQLKTAVSSGMSVRQTGPVATIVPTSISAPAAAEAAVGGVPGSNEECRAEKGPVPGFGFGYGFGRAFSSY